MSLQDTIRTFADRMYAYRVEMKITQEELAEMLALDNSYVSLLERGARVPSLIVLDKIAKVFGIKPIDLLRDTGKGDNFTFKQRELLYMIEKATPDEIDKIYRIMKIASQKPKKQSGGKP